MKKIVFGLLFLLLFLASCGKNEPIEEKEPDPVDPVIIEPTEEHVCSTFKTVITSEVICDEEYEVQVVCITSLISESCSNPHNPSLHKR